MDETRGEDCEEYIEHSRYNYIWDALEHVEESDSLTILETTTKREILENIGSSLAYNVIKLLESVGLKTADNWVRSVQ